MITEYLMDVNLYKQGFCDIFDIYLKPFSYISQTQ